MFHSLSKWLRLTKSERSDALGSSSLRFRTTLAPCRPVGSGPLSIPFRIPHYQRPTSAISWILMATNSISWQRLLPILSVGVMLGACASGTKITRVQDLSKSADVPYNKVLVISLFDAYDARRYLEKELVTQLAELGTDAVASTTMMDTRTPVTRATFVAMVDKIGADAVLVSQLASNEVTGEVKTQRPQSTYNVWPTYYYNVWSVQLTEYIEPPGVEFTHTLVLGTQLYSVKQEEPVWAIEADFKILEESDGAWSYSVFPNQAKAIASHLSRDKLVAR
jgi:hypothetical protein